MPADGDIYPIKRQDLTRFALIRVVYTDLAESHALDALWKQRAMGS